MRIRDWSSDVCSSDLSPPGLGQTLNSNVRVGIGRQQPLKQIALILLGRKADDIICAEPAKFGGEGDRQLVVQGKRVSVRVGRGGRRFIKNKKQDLDSYINNPL